LSNVTHPETPRGTHSREPEDHECDERFEQCHEEELPRP
jgi:hypothetical protein